MYKEGWGLFCLGWFGLCWLVGFVVCWLGLCWLVAFVVYCLGLFCCVLVWLRFVLLCVGLVCVGWLVGFVMCWFVFVFLFGLVGLIVCMFVLMHVFYFYLFFFCAGIYVFDLFTGFVFGWWIITLGCLSAPRLSNAFFGIERSGALPGEALSFHGTSKLR